MKLKTLLLLAMFLALVAPTIVSAACSCQFVDTCEEIGMANGAICGPSCATSGGKCCCDCIVLGAGGCGSGPMATKCCIGSEPLHCSVGHCCKVGEVWRGSACGPPCVPSCTTGLCGEPDDCGGTCTGSCPGGTCLLNYTTGNFSCCSASCGECGIDGCGGTCPDTCNPATEFCQNNACCTTDCTGGLCSDNHCGGVCGGCPDGYAYNRDTLACDLKVECDPECADKICGDSNGCGGICGCAGDDICWGALEDGEGYCISNMAVQGPACNCDTPDPGAGSTCVMNYNRCLSRSMVPGTVGLWVGCEQAKGETCWSDNKCNPGNCEDYTNYTCISNHCCEQDEIWDICSESCVRVTCASKSLPLPPENPYVIRCDNESDPLLVGENPLLLGTPLCEGTCGVACYHGFSGGVYSSVSCAGDEQCIHLAGMILTKAVNGVRCNMCVPNPTACCVSGMTATTDAQCKACDATWYLNGTHCCQKGMFWDPVGLICRARDPCYSALGFPTSSSYCNLFAPDIGSYGTCSLSSWLSSSPYCVDYSLTPPRTCCFVNAGIFGYAELDSQFYYWHESIPIVVY